MCCIRLADAFGLPTENFAIKNHVHPKIVTEQNIARFKQQLISLVFFLTGPVKLTPRTRNTINGHNGFSFSYFSTVLLIKKKMAVNWCTSCKWQKLANEEVVNGGCERCGSEVCA